MNNSCIACNNNLKPPPSKFCNTCLETHNQLPQIFTVFVQADTPSVHRFIDSHKAINTYDYICRFAPEGTNVRLINSDLGIVSSTVVRRVVENAI